MERGGQEVGEARIRERLPHRHTGYHISLIFIFSGLFLFTSWGWIFEALQHHACMANKHSTTAFLPVRQIARRQQIHQELLPVADIKHEERDSNQPMEPFQTEPDGKEGSGGAEASVGNVDMGPGKGLDHGQGQGVREHGRQEPVDLEVDQVEKAIDPEPDPTI